MSTFHFCSKMVKKKSRKRASLEKGYGPSQKYQLCQLFDFNEDSSLTCLSFVFTFGSVRRRWDSEQPSKKDTLKPKVSKIVGRALIVYHPGATGYIEEVAYAVGKALQTKGWEVLLDRANSKAISDLSDFNLLCVGSPTYSGSPRPPIVNYINRCSNLEKRACLVLTTGFHDPNESNKKLQNLLESKGGKVIGSLALFTKQKDQVDELTGEFVEKIAKLMESGTYLQRTLPSKYITERQTEQMDYLKSSKGVEKVL